MPGSDLAAIAAAISHRRRPGAVLVVAVDGPSGAGKTRLARRLGRSLGAHTIVRMDHVVPGWDGLEESVRLIRPVLQFLRSGESARYRVWDWSRDNWGQPLRREAAPTVVVEGCGSGALALSDLVDYLVWVDAPPGVRHGRAMRRDGEDYAGQWNRWAVQETRHFAVNRTAQRADLAIDGRYPVR